MIVETSSGKEQFFLTICGCRSAAAFGSRSWLGAKRGSRSGGSLP